MNSFLQAVADNALFFIQFMALVVLMFLIAYGMEKAARKKQDQKGRILSTRTLALVGMFSAIATILHVLDFPVPFAPPFYKLDFSELPVLIATFAFGPVAGVMTEFCKIILKLLFKGTGTAFVGDLANFLIGCSLLLPASALYMHKKTRKNAIAGAALGTLVMTVFGTAFNAIYLIPKFSELYGMPIDSIVAMGTAIHPSIDSVWPLAILCVAPLNLVKGAVISLLTVLIYKKISPIIKYEHKS